MKRDGGLLAPVRYRQFQLLWSAQIFSELGDWAGRLALGVVVAQRTDSAILTALVTTASVVPYIGIGQVLATWVNRFRRIRVIVVTDLGRGLLFAVLALHLPVWTILVFAFVAGCLTPPFEAARNSLTILTVPEHIYGDAVALASVTFDLSVLFGYAAGGALIASVGARPALLMNAASFVLSALLLSRMAVARRAPEGGAEVRVRDGWRAMVDDPFIRRFVVSYTVVGACAVVGESLVALYALRVLHRTAGVSGLLAAAIPAGAIVATIAARSHGDHGAKMRRSAAIAFAGSVVGLATFFAAPGLPVILVGFAAIGALNASRVPANEVTAVRLDDRMRGPTFTVLNGFLLGSQAAAAAAGGVIARGIGVRQTIALSLVLSAVVAAWALANPPRELRHRMGAAR